MIDSRGGGAQSARLQRRHTASSAKTQDRRRLFNLDTSATVAVSVAMTVLATPCALGDAFPAAPQRAGRPGDKQVSVDLELNQVVPQNAVIVVGQLGLAR